MIVDYFPFFAEYGDEILKLRINLLKDHVDYFVISESNKTHMGADTPMVFNEVSARLNLPKEKIIYVENIIPEASELVITEMDIANSINNTNNINSIRSKIRDRMQKDALLKVLDKFDDDTIFIHSDMDEIIKPDAIQYLANVCKNNQEIIIKVPLIHLEGRADLRVHVKETNETYDYSRSMFLATKLQLLKATPNQIRSNYNNPFPIQYVCQDGKRIEDLGWHFSWMGGKEIRLKKVNAWTHSEDNFEQLFFGSYNDDEYKKFIQRVVFKDGDLPPSSIKYHILRDYDEAELPKLIFEDIQLKKFFLPMEYNIKDIANIRKKLEDFPKLNILSTDDNNGRNRINSLNTDRDLFNLNYKVNSFKKYEQSEYKLFINETLFSSTEILENIKYNIFLNHVTMIKSWYEETDEEFGFFCEDDISFEAIKYWDFNWRQFIHSLPKSWDLIQLCVIADENNLNYDLNLIHKYNGHFWGLNSYLLSRKYAKKIIDEYTTEENNIFKITIPYELIGPIAIPEDLIYTLNNKKYYNYDQNGLIVDVKENENTAYGFQYDASNIYVKPLFVENLDFKSDDGLGLKMHYNCHEYTLKLWKKIYKEKTAHKVVIVTGGFDPIHSGHIEYFKDAKRLGDSLVVGVNSDEWLARKKGQPFLNQEERINIIKNLSMVDSVIKIDDSDGTAKSAIRFCLDNYPLSKIIFANGGDRTDGNIPEMSIPCSKEESERLSFKFGVGGSNKMNSSSKILTEWKTPKTERKWGYYRVLHSDGPSLKVKELVVEPGKSLSVQRHDLRSEYWIVSEGIATVKHGSNPELLEISKLQKHDEIHIPVGAWHQLVNEKDLDLRIVEVQFGTNCIEEDIERI